MNVWIVAATVTRRVPCSTEAHEHAEPSWGPGPAVVRVGRPTGGRSSLNRNEDGFGRAGASSRSPGTAPRSSVSQGLAHRPRLGRARASSCIRSGGRTAPQLTVLDPATGARDVAAARRAGRARRRRPARADADHLAGRRRRRPCTGSSGSRPPTASTAPGRCAAAAGRRARRADRPVARSTGGPASATSSSRGWAVLSPNYRGSTGYGRDYRHALDHEWGVVDVADTVAGIRAAGHDGWVDTARAAVMGGSAGGFTALLVAAHTPPVVRAAVSLFGVDRPLRPRGHDPPIRVAVPRPSRRPAARARRPLRGAVAGDARARDRGARARAAGCRRQGGAAGAGAAAGRLDARRRRAPSSTTCTTARATASRRRRPSSTRSNASTRSSRDGWCNDDRR